MEADHCDVLILGGGPAGSSCAWALRESGLDILVLDRNAFPRDKICAGWITPQILTELEIDPADYRKERVLQPIRGFRVGRVGDRSVTTEHGEVVSYGIRRCEFDHYLLERCGARLRLGESLGEIEKTHSGWKVNGITTRVLIGAGGHFCPVARHLGALPGQGEAAVVAREIEFEMTAGQQAACPASGTIPELFFAEDLKGYGWVVRKGSWLNVGFGRQDQSAFPAHIEAFLEFLQREGRLPPDMPPRLKGHAYLLYDSAPRPLADEDVLLIGDAAGLAYPRSGEGIRPAVESGLLAARALMGAGGVASPAACAEYESEMTRRFGARRDTPPTGPTDWLPPSWRGPLAGKLLGTEWFARNFVVDRWFLHRHDPPLPPA